MANRARRKVPNHVRKLAYLRRVGALPNGAHKVDVLHDDWCRIFAGGNCNCDPDVKIRWSQPASRGDKAASKSTTPADCL